MNLLLQSLINITSSTLDRITSKKYSDTIECT